MKEIKELLSTNLITVFKNFDKEISDEAKKDICEEAFKHLDNGLRLTKAMEENSSDSDIVLDAENLFLNDLNNNLEAFSKENKTLVITSWIGVIDNSPEEMNSKILKLLHSSFGQNLIDIINGEYNSAL